MGWTSCFKISTESIVVTLTDKNARVAEWQTTINMRKLKFCRCMSSIRNVYGDTAKKLYGPYYRKDGRQHVIIYYLDGTKKTVSYPKYLMEMKIGRELDPMYETVDHVDRDFTNNNYANLRVVSRQEHVSEDHVRIDKVIVKCIWCDAEVNRRAVDLDRNARLGKAGPFCRKCAGKYGTSIQHHGAERLQAQPRLPISKRRYYKVNKAG